MFVGHVGPIFFLRVPFFTLCPVPHPMERSAGRRQEGREIPSGIPRRRSSLANSEESFMPEPISSRKARLSPCRQYSFMNPLIGSRIF